MELPRGHAQLHSGPSDMGNLLTEEQVYPQQVCHGCREHDGKRLALAPSHSLPRPPRTPLARAAHPLQILRVEAARMGTGSRTHPSRTPSPHSPLLWQGHPNGLAVFAAQCAPSSGLKRCFSSWYPNLSEEFSYLHKCCTPPKTDILPSPPSFSSGPSTWTTGGEDAEVVAVKTWGCHLFVSIALRRSGPVFWILSLGWGGGLGVSFISAVGPKTEASQTACFLNLVARGLFLNTRISQISILIMGQNPGPFWEKCAWFIHKFIFYGLLSNHTI